jgi:hypothetical protein
MQLYKLGVISQKRTRTHIKYKCEICGSENITTYSDYKRRKTNRCIKCINYKHGLSKANKKNVLYKKWSSIKTRCLNENDDAYKYYGGRGIKLWEPWLDNPEAFILYVSNLPNCPKKEFDNYTIDRVNNDGNYEPMNLRWATRSEQAYNRRTTGAIEEKYIMYCKKESKPYRVYKDKRFKTLEEALARRKVRYGF